MMTEVTKKLRKRLSILLIAAIVVSPLPQRNLTVYATEESAAIDPVGGEDSAPEAPGDEWKEAENEPEDKLDNTALTDSETPSQKEEVPDILTGEDAVPRATDSTPDEATPSSPVNNTEEDAYEGELASSSVLVSDDSAFTAEANKLSFKAEGFAEAKVTPAGETAPSILKDGEEKVIEATAADVTIEPGKGYKIDSVSWSPNGVASPSEAEAALTSTSSQIDLQTWDKWQVHFGENSQNVILTVKTSEKPKKNVFFANKAGSSLTLKVDTGKNSGVTKKTGSYQNAFELNAETPTLNFTVTANALYTPVVTYADEDGVLKPIDYTGSPTVNNNTRKTTYTYRVEADSLPETAVLTLRADLTGKTVEVRYDSETVEITGARIGAQVIEGIEIRDNSSENKFLGMQYPVKEGQTVTVSVKAKDFYRITRVQSSTSTKPLLNKPSQNYEANIKVSGDDTTTVTIDSEGMYNVQLYPVDDGELAKIPLEADSKGIYTLETNTKYIPLLYKGARDDVHQTAIHEIKSSKTAAVTPSKAAVSEAENLIIDAKNSGNNITVTLYVSAMNDKGQETKVAAAAFKVNVLPAHKEATNITVAGVAKNGGLSQQTGVTKEYKITLTPKEARWENTDIAAEVVNSEEEDALYAVAASSDVSVDKETGTLRITTTGTVGGSSKIHLYKTTGSDAGKILKTITVKAVNQWSGVKPSLTLKSADDISLEVTVGLSSSDNKKVQQSGEREGSLVYKITASPVATDKATPSAVSVVKYEKKAADSLTQTIRLPVFEEDTGKGEGRKQDYQVTVQLLHISKDSVEEVNEAKDIVCSSQTNKKKMSTKAPFYETNLKLTTRTKQIYTGQKDVPVAVPVFSKDTTFRDIDEDTISDSVQGEGALKFHVENGVIYASATDKTTVGSHKITVFAQAPDKTYAASAAVTVKVIQGIDSLKVTLPSLWIYKPVNKAPTLKASVIYNHGESNPQTKKVTWRIVPESEDKAAAANLMKMVTVKADGTITVNKNYLVQPNTNIQANQFTVEAVAADYTHGEAVVGKSDVITITSEAIAMERVVLAKETDGGNYQVVARAGDTVASQELENAALYALKRGTAETGIFTAEDIVDVDCLTFKSSNKAVSIDAFTGEIGEITNIAKNVTLTASANDGSAQKASMKFHIGYATPKNGLELKFKLRDGGLFDTGFGFNLVPPFKTWTQVNFAGTAGTVFYVHVVDGRGKPLTDFTNYTLKITGAKEFYTSPVYDKNGTGISQSERMIVMNTKEATLTLTDLSKGKNEPGYQTLYKITNTSLKDVSTTAPTATLNPGSVEGTDSPKTVVGKVTLKGVKNYNYSAKHVMVETDFSAVNKEKGSALAAYEEFEKVFLQSVPKKEPIPLEDDGTFSMKLQGLDNVPAGSYKIKVTLGEINADNVFTPVYAPQVVTLKITTPKAGKTAVFKPTTSYRVSPRSSGKVMLTGKVGKLDANYAGELIWSNLRNANVGGSGTGFTKFFTLDESGNYLRFKDELTPEQCKDFEQMYPNAKKALTGYVDYSYIGRDDGLLQKGTVKLTVFAGMTDAYSTPEVTTVRTVIATKSDAKGKVTVSEASALAMLHVNFETQQWDDKILYAYAEDTGKNDGTAYGDGKFKVESVTQSGEITLTAKAPGLHKHSINLWVVPASSRYKNIFAELERTANSDAAKKAAFQEYGIQIKTSVTVKKEDAQGKITFAKATDTKHTFVSKDYNPADGAYRVEIPCTIADGCAIERINSSNTLITFEHQPDKFEPSAGRFTDSITASVNKEALRKAVEDKTAKYKGKLSVTATVIFQGERTKETIKFTLTLPNKAETDEVIIQGIQKNAETIAERNPLNLTKKMLKDEQTVRARIEEISKELAKAVRDLIPLDSDVQVKWNDSEDEPVTSNEFHAPTSEEAGSAVISVELIPRNEQEGAALEVIRFTYDLPATGKEPKDLSDKLSEALAAAATDEPAWRIKNTTTQEQIADKLRAHLGIGGEDSGHLRLYLTAFHCSRAEIGKEGAITFFVTITDVKYGSELFNRYVTLPIAPLRSESDMIKSLEELVTEEAARDIAGSNVKADVRSELQRRINLAIGSNPYICEPGDSEFAFQPVTFTKKGSISYTLQLKDEKTGKPVEGMAPSRTGKIELATNPEFETLAEAMGEIEEKIGKNTYPGTPSNTATAAEARKKLQDSITGSKIHVEMKTFDVTPATMRVPGSIRFQYVLTRDGEEALSSDVITAKIEMLPQTPDNAVDAMDKALKALTWTNDATQESVAAKDSVVNAISSSYTLEIFGFTVTPSTINKTGTVRFTWWLSYNAASGSETSMTSSAPKNFEGEIAELEQTDWEAQSAVREALSEFNKNYSMPNNMTAEDVVNHVKPYIKESVYTFTATRTEADDFYKEATVHEEGVFDFSFALEKKTQEGVKTIWSNGAPTRYTMETLIDKESLEAAINEELIEHNKKTGLNIKVFEDKKTNDVLNVLKDSFKEQTNWYEFNVDNVEVTSPTATEYGMIAGTISIRIGTPAGVKTVEVTVDAPIQRHLIAVYYCNCSYDTSDYNELKLHMAEHAKKGELYSYDWVYHYE